jgi:hypothetical protein
MSFLLSVAIKAIILNVIMMSVVMLNVGGPYRQDWFTVELILIGVPSLVSWHHQCRVKALVSKILFLFLTKKHLLFNQEPTLQIIFWSIHSIL